MGAGVELVKRERKKESEVRLGRIAALDGSYIMHRNMHVPEFWELRSPAGERSGGIFGFLMSLYYQIRMMPQKAGSLYYPVVCWDSGLSEFRTEIYDQYKHHANKVSGVYYAERQAETEDEDYLTQYRRQRDIVISLLRYMGVPYVKVEGWEGDDLIKIISKIAESTVVVSDDRDMLQLLNDEDGIYVYRPMADEFWTEDAYLRKQDFMSVREAVIHKAITGDASDNIPPVTEGMGNKYRVGDKRARTIARIIYDNPQDYQAVLEQYGKNPYVGFLQAHDKFLRNMKLVDLDMVPQDQELVKMIEASINTAQQDIDVFQAYRVLGEQGITKFDPGEVITLIKQLASLRFKEGV